MKNRNKVIDLICGWGGSGFPIAYLTWAALSGVGYFSGLAVMKGLAAVLAVWGAVAAVCSLRRFWGGGAKREMILFAAFFLSYAVSSLVNREYGISGNLKAMVWMGLCLFAAYPAGLTERQEGRSLKGRPLYEWFILVLMVFTSIMAAVGLVMWATGYSAYVNKDTIHGFMWGRLWGAYGDPNYGSVLSVASISCALMYLLQGKERHPHRVLLAGHILLLELYIIGAYSRGTQVVMMATTALFYVFYIVTQKKSVRRKIAVGVVLAVFLALPWVVRAAYNSYAERHNEEVEAQIQAAIEAGLDPEELDIDDPMDEMERSSVFEQRSFSIRFGIWKDGLELWKLSPVFGVSYRNIQAFAKANDTGRYVNRAINTMHNMVIDVAVSQGILGLVLLAVTAAVLVVSMIRGWLRFTPQEREEAMLFLLPVLTVLGGSLTLSDIFYLNTPTTVVFWTMLGHYMALCYGKAPKKGPAAAR